MSPTSSVWLTSAWYSSVRKVGAGCGGVKPCVTESADASGNPTYTSGSPVVSATVYTSGISTRNPAL
jgi:hypothetical protein